MDESLPLLRRRAPKTPSTEGELKTPGTAVAARRALKLYRRQRREGANWHMQPFWALSFPSLDALEECEQRRNGSGKTQNRGDKLPRGAKTPKSGRSNDKLNKAIAEVTAMPYGELIAEHFARAVYIA